MHFAHFCVAKVCKVSACSAKLSTPGARPAALLNFCFSKSHFGANTGRRRGCPYGGRKQVQLAKGALLLALGVLSEDEVTHAGACSCSLLARYLRTFA